MQELTMSKGDKIWFGYTNDDGQIVSLVLEGFGFEGSIDEAKKHPRYDEICGLFKALAIKILEIEEE